MNFVPVAAAAGGVGATTVAAHLAACLQRRRRLGAAFDFCPGNALRLHLGMEWGDGAGFAPQVLAGRPWFEAAYRSADGVAFLPFGQVADEGEALRFAAWLEERPGGLAGCLSEIRLAADAVILADLPRSPWRLVRPALTCSRLAVVVVAPDAVSYAALPGLLDDLAGAGAGEVAVLLNGFDPTRTLDRDMALLLAHAPGSRLAPVKIHRDEAVREALASKQTVFDYAPSSQAAHDFAAFATWLLTRLGQEKY